VFQIRVKYFILVFTLVYLNKVYCSSDSLRVALAVRTLQEPKLDGKLDDDCWKNGVLINNFTQNLPIQKAKPTQATDVRILYDDYAIYIGAMMYDSAPDSILHELGSRDDADLNSDFFSFRIDPYNTRKDAFIFSVYASGVQVDEKFSDPTFDAVWISEVDINEKGWSLEIKIPYSAFRFPKKVKQEWAMQMIRSIRRNREFDQWAFTPPTESSPLKLWGTLRGIENIKLPLRLSFTPYVSFYEERSPFSELDGTYKYANTFSYNAGVDMKYGIDERFTIDMSLLPDFGQVQFDRKVKNLGYREVIYDENRSFFKESTELFSKNSLFYSRRIGKTPVGFYAVSYQLRPGEELIENPSRVKLLNAIKLSGRNNNGLGIGVFNAVTDRMEAIVKDSIGNTRKIMTEPLTNYNVIVFDQQLKNNSSVYFINTNVIREKNSNDANVTGTGCTLFNKKNTLATDGNFTLSQKYVKVPGAAETYQNQLGYNYFLGIRKTGGVFGYGLGHEVMNNTFNRSDLGFQSVNNYGSLNLYVEHNLYKPWRFLRNSSSSSNISYGYNYLTGHRIDLGYELNLFVTLLNYHSFFAGGNTSPTSLYDYNEPRVPGRFYRTSQYYYLYAGISSDYRKKLAVDMTISMANFFKSNTNNLLAKAGYAATPKIRYRFSNRMSATYAFCYDYDPFNPGFVTFDALGDIVMGARELHTIENSFLLKYIFNPRMALNINARHYWITGEYKNNYYRLDNDGYLSHYDNYPTSNDFNYNAFNIDVVYTWQFAPGSMLNFTYKNAIEKDDVVVISHFGKNFDNTISSPQTNSVSLRLVYFLDYLYFKKKKQVN